MNVWAARVLHFALPIRAGDRVAVIGPSSAALLTSLRQSKVDVVELGIGADSGDEAQFDYAIVPAMKTRHQKELCARLSRLVRPGGGVLIVVANTERVMNRLPGWTPGRGKRTLETHGFASVETYGIPNKIEVPQILVPLGHPGAVRWYARSTYMPSSLIGAIVIGLLERLPSAWIRPLLFPTLAFAGKREVTPGTAAC